ncbi:hypothetical protein QAD02_001087 [Eretmocerus hayati]|uniref:Uncharacterized protein n=1 Tax=Eretmocerus hayati TaxID=131215 RepID=A0ACC2NGC6_9HYME|nr:hypothetical protein QAD02_001087 [Eretmocerus hayati]
MEWVPGDVTPLKAIEPREEIDGFIDRFGNTVREYQSFDGVVPPTSEELRSSLYNAVAEHTSELRRISFSRNATCDAPLNLASMKTFSLKLETEKNSDNTLSDPTVYASKTYYKP